MSEHRYIPPHKRNQPSHPDLKDSDDDEGLDQIHDKFKCVICHDVVQVPTRLLCPAGQGPDSCRTIACLRCLRNYLNLSKPPNYRGVAKCLICHAEIACGAEICHKIYRVVDDIFDIMDEAVSTYKPAFKCRTCGKQCTSQQNLWRHFRDECPDSTTCCKHPGCNKWGLRKFIEGEHAEDHIVIHCNLCHRSFGKRQILNHLREEREIYLKKQRDVEYSLGWISEKMAELSPSPALLLPTPVQNS